MIWQTAAWGKMLKKSNQVEKIIYCGDIQIEKRSLGFCLYGFFILGLTRSLLPDEKNDIHNSAKKEGVLFIQIEYVNYSGNLIDNMNGQYYKKFITPYTAVIPLNSSLENILSLMKPKGRYNIKLAAKKGIVVESVEKNNININLFFHLMQETTSRDKFSGNTFSYYQTFLETLQSSELLFAWKDEVVVAAGIFIFEEEVSLYYYGASSSNKEYRNLMAPYLLQWFAIELAQSKGSKLYDFLGVSGPGNITSSLAGVTSFKTKLTKDVRHVSSSDLIVIKKGIYFIFSLLRKILGKS